MTTRTHNGTEHTIDSTTFTLHDSATAGCTLIRAAGKVVGWWVNTPDRSKTGTAVFVFDAKGCQHRVGRARTMPKAVAMLAESLAPNPKE